MDRVQIRRRLLIVGGFALIIATGFVREFVFLNINEQLAFLYYGHETSNMSWVLGFLGVLTYDQLYWFKWLLTPVFATVFCFETMLSLKQLFGDAHAKETLALFVGLLALSAVLFGGFWVFGDIVGGYTQARFLMGLAQSPFPLMLLIPAILLKKRLPNR